MAEANQRINFDWLAKALACRLDFTKADSPDLEESFYRRLPAATAGNVTSSDSIVDRELGVGGTYRKPGMEHLRALLSAHEFTASQRELFLRRERRKTIWTYCLKNQNVQGDDLDAVLKRCASSDNYSYVLDRPIRFALAEDPNLLSIFEQAEVASQVKAMAANLVPSLDHLAGTYVEALITQDVWYTREATEVLIDQRVDLHDVIIDVATPTVLAQLAASRHLKDVNRQRAVAGLDLVFLRRGDRRLWAGTLATTINHLVINPRCHREVLEELLERLTSIDGLLPKTVARIEKRLTDFEVHPVYTGDFETESDPDIIVWLSDLYFPPSAGETRRPIDQHESATKALALNEAFMDHPHNANLDAYHVRNILGKVVRDRWESPQERMKLAQRINEVPLSELGSAHMNESVLYIQEKLGSSASSYETLLGLSRGWDGSFLELVECASGLKA